MGKSQRVFLLCPIFKKNTKSLAINFYHLVQKLTDRDFLHLKRYSDLHIRWFHQYFELYIYQFDSLDVGWLLIVYFMVFMIFLFFIFRTQNGPSKLFLFQQLSIQCTMGWNPSWGSNLILWNCVFMRNVFSLWNISVSMFHEYLVKTQVHKNKNAPSVRISLFVHFKCHQSS